MILPAVAAPPGSSPSGPAGPDPDGPDGTTDPEPGRPDPDPGAVPVAVPAAAPDAGPAAAPGAGRTEMLALPGQTSHVARPRVLARTVGRTVGAAARVAGFEVTGSADGTYRLVRTARDGTTTAITLTARVGPVGSPETVLAVAQVDVDAATVEITISEHARRRAVGRALAYQLATAAERFGPSDSPVDPGRIVELLYVQERMRTANPVARLDDLADLPALVRAATTITTRITDSWVPGSSMHAEASPLARPDGVRRELTRLLGRDLARVAAAAGLRYADLGGDRITLQTERGVIFTVDPTVVAAHRMEPSSEVGGVVRRPTAVAGVDSRRRRVDLRVSDRARLPYLGDDRAVPDPAYVNDLFRAVVHELTEAAALLDSEVLDGGGHETEDALTPEGAATGRPLTAGRLTPHDHGRLAEVGVLLDAMDEPALRQHAAHELAVLLDSLVGLPTAIGPDTDVETLTLLRALTPAAGPDAQLAAVNGLMAEAARSLADVAPAWPLFSAAADAAGAVAARIGGRWIVLADQDGQVAIQLRPPGPDPDRAELPPPAGIDRSRVRRLTMPPAGTDPAEYARIVERTVAAALAETAAVPTGPGVISEDPLTAEPGPADVTTADVAVVADLAAAVRPHLGTRIDRATAAALGELLRSTGLDPALPDAELALLALRDAQVRGRAVLDADVLDVLRQVDPATRPLRGRVRDRAEAAARALGRAGGVTDVRPVGDGLLRARVGAARTPVVVQVVPGRLPAGRLVDVEVDGRVITLTVSADARPGRLAGPVAAAVTEALLDAAQTPALSPPSPGTRLLWETATVLAADTVRVPGGGLALAGLDGVRRLVPRQRVHEIADTLDGQLRDGMDTERVRATAARMLGEEAAAGTGHPDVAGALDALAWLGEARPQSGPAVLEKAAATLPAGTGHRDLAELPGAARTLADRVTASRPGTDDLAPFRPGRHRPEVSSLLAEAGALARVAGTPDPTLPVQAIGASVRDLAEALAQVETGLTDRSRAARGRRIAALAADLDAVGKMVQARADRDQDAGERARLAVKERREQLEAAQRHRRAEERYAAAARPLGDARQHLAAAAAALAELADLAELTEPAPAGAGSTADTGRIAELAARVESAAQAVELAYQNHTDALREALPPDGPAVAASGMPNGDLPGLAELAEELNTQLEAHGVADRVTPEGLNWYLRAQWPRVASGEGAVLWAGLGPGAVELRIRAALRDPVEVVGGAVEHSESIGGQFPQAGTTVGRVLNQSQSHSHRIPRAPEAFQAFLESLPDDPLSTNIKAGLLSLYAAGTVVDPSGRWSVSTSTTSVSAGVSQRGTVDDNRGDAALYDYLTRWDVRVESVATPPAERAWTPVEPTPGRDSRPTLRMRVSHAYAERAGTRVVQLLRPTPRPAFPEHHYTRISGGERILDLVAASTGTPAADRAALRILLDEAVPKGLHDSVNSPLGLPLQLRDDTGRLVADLRVRTEVVPGSARMAGIPSAKQHLERLRIGFSRATSRASEAWRFGLDGRAGAERALEDGDPDDGLSVLARFLGGPGWTWSRPREVFAGGQAIHPIVRRWAGHTRAYEVTFRHAITVHPVGRSRPNPPIEVEESGLVRMAENEAFRYGFPVDAAAVVGHHPDGQLRLRDDLDLTPPPGRLPTFPPWLLGRDGMRGAGHASVQAMTAADPVVESVVRDLQDQGWLPRTREDGTVVPTADPVLLESQLENLGRLMDQLNPAALETGYDQATQDGLFVDLVRRRRFRWPEHRTLRVQLVRSSEPAYRGRLDAEKIVNLNIGAETSGRTRTGSAAASIGLQARGREQAEDPAQESWLDSLTGGLTGERARSASSTAENSENLVRLLESTGETAVFSVEHTLQVHEHAGDGTWTPIGVPGRVTGEVLLPVDFLPREGAPEEPGRVDREGERTVEEFLAPRQQRATFVHADLGEVLAAVIRVAPRGTEAALPHFARFADVRNVLAHPEMTVMPYETSVEWRVNRLVGVSPLRSTVSLRMRPRGLRFVDTAALVAGDINFALDGHSVTVNRTGSQAGEVVGGGPASAAGTSSRSSSTSVRQGGGTSGAEVLSIGTGLQYLFRMDVDTEVTADELGTAGTVTVPGGTVLTAFSERDVLDWYVTDGFPLPARQVADAVQRVFNGALAIDAAVAIPLVAKYLAETPTADRAAVAAWLAATYPVLLRGLPTPTAATVDALLRMVGHSIQPVRVVVPEHLPHGGHTAVEQVHLTRAGVREDAATGTPTPTREPVHDLAAEVLDTLRRVAPELAADPELRRRVRGLAGGPQRWQGRLRTTVERDGWLLLDEQSGGDRVTVRIRAELRTEEAEYLGTDRNIGLIKQLYYFATRGVSQGAGWSGGGRGTGPASGSGVDATAATDVSQSGSRSLGRVLTVLSRMSSFGGVDRVRHPVVVTVAAQRSPERGRPAARPTEPGRVPPPVEQRLEGTMVRLLPTGLLRPSAGRWARPLPTRYADVRQLRLMERFFPQDAALPDLKDQVVARLARRDQLGARGLRDQRLHLEDMLSPTAILNSLSFVQAEGGHRLGTLAVPGHRDRVIEVWVEAAVSEPQVVVEGQGPDEIGAVHRDEETWSASVERSHAVPGSGTMAQFGQSVTVGARDSLTASTAGGGRAEQSSLDKGKHDTVKVRLDATVTIRTLRVRPDRPVAVLATETLPGPSVGWAYLTAFSDAVGTTRAELEDDTRIDHGEWRDTSRPVDPGAAEHRPDDDLDPRLQALLRLAAGPPAPVALADLYPPDRREELMEPDLREFEKRNPYYNPYPQMARTLRERMPAIGSTGGVVWVTAREIAEQPFRELIRLRVLAREARVTLLADVLDAQGVLRPYRIDQHGQVRSRVDDGGFADALGRVPYPLQELAAQRIEDSPPPLDLREFFHRTSGDERPFSARIRAELARRKVSYEPDRLAWPEHPIRPHATASRPGPSVAGYGQGTVGTGAFSPVPGSGSHGTAAAAPRPAAVRAEVAAVLADPARLAALAGVPRDGTGRYVTRGGVAFDPQVRVVPAAEVGPPVVVAGVEYRPAAGFTVRADGSVEIRVSDRARLSTDPGAVREVLRALAHEVAEVAAVLDGAPAEDQLVPPAGRAPDPGRLSGHDRGRLAELRVLLDARADPAGRGPADRELALLLAHLGDRSGPEVAAAVRNLLGRATPAGVPGRPAPVPGPGSPGTDLPPARPEEVAAEVAAVLEGHIAATAVATGLRRSRVLGDRRSEWRTEEGEPFRATWSVVPAAEVGTAVGAGRPTAAATVDLRTREVHLRVSDRARTRLAGDSRPDPRWVHDVRRAVARELAEAAALLDGAPRRPDALTPDRAAYARSSRTRISPRELSGRDRGRLAEVVVLLDAVRDPALRESAAAELAFLLDSLIGLPVAVDPGTGAVPGTGRPVQDPVLPDLATAADVAARAVVVNRMVQQIPEALLGVADARHLVRVAALGAGATVTPAGTGWIVLAADGRRVALHLRPADPPPGRVDPPGPRLRDQPPPAVRAVDRVLRLTLPPAGTPEEEIVRSVDRAVATAVAGLRGRPPGPGLLARDGLTAAPAAGEVTAADAAAVAELLPAVRHWAGGGRPARRAGARALLDRLSAARVDLDRPGGELRYRALRAAGLVPDDVDGMLGTLRGARPARWRAEVRDAAVAAAGGEVRLDPVGEGLATVPGTQVTVEVVPGRPAGGALVAARVSGGLVTVTARPDTDPRSLAGPMAAALADVLRTALDAPVPAAPIPSPGAVLLAEVATAAAADVRWSPDGGLRIAGPDGIRRDVPAPEVGALAAELDRGLAAGVGADALTATALARLGWGDPSGTDSYVPGSGSHGTAATEPRDAEVRAEVAAVRADPARLAAMAGVSFRTGPDGSTEYVTAAGVPFVLEPEVRPFHEVGPPTTVDGVQRWPTAGYTVRTDPAGRHVVQVGVSGRARLSTDPGGVLEILRALAHELGEAALSIDDPAAAGSGSPAPHVRGRQSEVRVLLLARRDPALRAAADAELGLLLVDLYGGTLLQEQPVRVVRRAGPEHVPVIEALRREAAERLAARGVDPERHGPDTDRVVASVAAGDTWVALDLDGTVVGTVTVDEHADPDLRTAADDPDAALHVRRLVVAGRAAGTGLGTALLDHAGRVATDAGRRWLRLDTSRDNPGLAEFAEQQGFEPVRTAGPGALFQRPAAQSRGLTRAELIARSTLAAVLDELSAASPADRRRLAAEADRLLADLGIAADDDRRARLGPHLAGRAGLHRLRQAAAAAWTGTAATTLATAVEAMERAARAAAGSGDVVVVDGGIEVRLPGRDPFRVVPALGDVPGGRPLRARDTTPGVLTLTLNPRFTDAGLRRVVAATVTGTVLAARGDVPIGPSVLVGSRTGPLTVVDHQALASLREAVRHVRSASGARRLEAVRVLSRLAEMLGLGTDPTGADAGRALVRADPLLAGLPPLTADLEELVDGAALRPGWRHRLDNLARRPGESDHDYVQRMALLSDTTGWIPPEPELAPLGGTGVPGGPGPAEEPGGGGPAPEPPGSGGPGPAEPGSDEPGPGGPAPGAPAPGEPAPGVPAPGELDSRGPDPGALAPGEPGSGAPAPGGPGSGGAAPGGPGPGGSAPGRSDAPGGTGTPGNPGTPGGPGPSAGPGVPGAAGVPSGPSARPGGTEGPPVPGGPGGLPGPPDERGAGLGGNRSDHAGGTSSAGSAGSGAGSAGSGDSGDSGDSGNADGSGSGNGNADGNGNGNADGSGSGNGSADGSGDSGHSSGGSGRGGSGGSGGTDSARRDDPHRSDPHDRQPAGPGGVRPGHISRLINFDLGGAEPAAQDGSGAGGSPRPDRDRQPDEPHREDRHRDDDRTRPDDAPAAGPGGPSPVGRGPADESFVPATGSDGVAGRVLRREHDPETGRTATWYELLDERGQVVHVVPVAPPEDPWPDAPEAQEVRQMLQDLASGHRPPSAVAEWASRWVAADTVTVTDPAVWAALVELSGAALATAAGEPVHSQDDYRAWHADHDRPGR